MALDPATQVLTSVSILLLAGIITSLIARKVKISNILLLTLLGVILGQFIDSNDLHFSSVFLVSIAVLSLVIIIFDGTSRFELRKVDLFSVKAIKVTIAFLLFNIILVAPAAMILFFGAQSIEAILFAVLLAVVLAGTDPGSTFVMLRTKSNKVIEFLEVEAILNTPIIVIIPFIIIDLLSTTGEGFAGIILNQAIPFLKQIVAGVGAGVLIGIIVFKTMKKVYSQHFSPIGLITSALLAYILAENLEGNGVLAVATLGLFFGNIYVKEKENLQEFNNILGNSLVVLVFILVGLIVKVNLSLIFLLKALIIYAILTISRLAATQAGLRNSNFNFKEKLFIALSMPKGVAVATVAFSLSVFAIPESITILRDQVLQLIIITLVYSLLFSSIIDRFSYYFIRVKIEPNE